MGFSFHDEKPVVELASTESLCFSSTNDHLNPISETGSTSDVTDVNQERRVGNLQLVELHDSNIQTVDGSEAEET